MNVLTAYDPGARLVIGHRGAAARFPENTFASFDHAIALGVDAIEFDLRITGDGVVVVMHDPTLDRTTNASGVVASLTATDLSAADAGARFSPDGRTFPFAGKGLSIPTLEGLLDRYRDIPLLIELKVPEVAAEALRLFRRHDCEDRVVVDSIDIRALHPFRGTSVATGAAKRDVLSLIWRGAAGLLPPSLPYSAVCIPERYQWVKVPVARLVESAGKRGVPTHVWTVNDPADARRLWNEGVMGIISDDPAVIVELRRSLGQTAI
jgi:glycerophosphoryl diester phosphodiesterase